MPKVERIFLLNLLSSLFKSQGAQLNLSPTSWSIKRSLNLILGSMVLTNQLPNSQPYSFLQSPSCTLRVHFHTLSPTFWHQLSTLICEVAMYLSYSKALVPVSFQHVTHSHFLVFCNLLSKRERKLFFFVL